MTQLSVDNLAYQLDDKEAAQVRGGFGFFQSWALLTLPASKVSSNSQSENVRSQAEKRLEQQRKALVQNWAG